jgi:integrase/recombinase XerD
MHENITFRWWHMAQAKTLNKTELKQLLDVTNSCSRYPLRDSTMLLFTHLCGLRVGEVAALRFDDVLDANGTVRDEMTLDAARTKSNEHVRYFFQSRCSVSCKHTLAA